VWPGVWPGAAFGKTPVERWCPAGRLYERAGVHDPFYLYHDDHGVDHNVSPEMWNDIVDTFRTALGTPVTPHDDGKRTRCSVDRAATRTLRPASQRAKSFLH
jgi:hypothetical protein